MQINLDSKNLASVVDGNKTYMVLLGGALVIVLNHFGLLPPEYAPANLDPNNWIMQLFALATGATARSALKKLETDALPPDKVAKLDDLERLFGPLVKPALEDAFVAMATKHGLVKPPAAPSGASGPAGP